MRSAASASSRAGEHDQDAAAIAAWLRELVRHVDAARATLLQILSFEHERIAGRTIVRDSPLTVGQIARLVLCYRTGEDPLSSGWESVDSHPTMQAYATAVDRTVRRSESREDGPSDGSLSLCRWLPEVLQPPSRVSATRAASIASDIAGLVSLLKDADGGLACWAFTTLQEVSSDRLEGLVAHLRDDEPTRIRVVHYGVSTSIDGGSRVGAVAATIIAQRMQREDLMHVVQIWDRLPSPYRFLEIADKVQSGWEEFR